jgi:hypothetical protein
MVVIRSNLTPLVGGITVFLLVLIHKGADKWTLGRFYKAVGQIVLLYDCETWVINPRMLIRLECFHNQIARRLTGGAPLLYRDTNVWFYPPLGNAFAEAGFYIMLEYIS